MTIYNSLIVALWLLFFAVWVAMAAGVKRTIDAPSWRCQIAWRVVVVALVVLALHVPGVRHLVRSAPVYTIGAGAMAGVVGVVLCTLGIGVAIWARACLGRNWGVPMSRKENPQLVTSGPYAYVRHPIYTGMLLAMVGSAIGESALWLLVPALAGGFFVYSARREEKLMAEQFPEHYPAYLKRTKMLIPFVV